MYLFGEKQISENYPNNFTKMCFVCLWTVFTRPSAWPIRVPMSLYHSLSPGYCPGWTVIGNSAQLTDKMDPKYIIISSEVSGFHNDAHLGFLKNWRTIFFSAVSQHPDHLKGWYLIRMTPSVLGAKFSFHPKKCHKVWYSSHSYQCNFGPKQIQSVNKNCREKN